MLKLTPDVYLAYSSKIAGSPLFDVDYYATVSGVSGDVSNLIKHYIEIGEESGLKPSEAFDPALYELGNPDVKEAGINKLYHYLAHGQAEGRFGNKHQVRDAAKLIKSKAFFDESYYRGHSEFMIPDLDPCEEQLALWRLGLNPNQRFDCAFYADLYPDSALYGKSPMHHYLEVGKAQCRVTNWSEYEALHELIEKHLDRRFYVSKAPYLADEADLARHYISIGVFKGLNPTKDFSLDYYLRAYRDILTSGSFPYAHYVLHGREEGRKGNPNFLKLIEKGGLEFDSQKATLVICNHEASRTGAPLVGLNLARALSEKYNIITILGVVRNMYDAFLEYSCALTTANYSALDGEYLLNYLRTEYNAKGIILNSAETNVLAQSAANANLPAVALVHEFAEYTKPAGRIAEIARLVDSIVVPAKLVQASVQNDIYLACSSEASNVEICAQGALPWLPKGSTDADMTPQYIIDYLKKKSPGKTKFVLGGGHVQIRKGVDLFVQTAYEVSKYRNDVAFLWVGDGYSPDHDMAYSVWVKEMINRMDLLDTVHFFPPQSSLNAFYDISSLFYLSSRLDPFPNVIIDALQADKTVLCFDKATGCAELFTTGQAVGAAVPYCDVAAAAAYVVSIVGTEGSTGINRQLVTDKFNFAEYANFIELKINQAVEKHEQQIASAAYLADANLFDPVMYVGAKYGMQMAQAALNDYVVGSSKGLSRRNPLRGFSENLFYSKHGVADGRPALERALRDAGGDKKLIQTHASYEIGNPLSTQSQPRSNQKALLHIHAHYPDEIAGFVQRLNRSRVKLDVLATATSQENYLHVQYLLSKYTGGKVTTRLIENIGRDVGPFLTEAADEALNGAYDIVGHLHTKKSLGWNAAAGASWKDYLLDTLLGNGGSTLKDIFALFGKDETLGLIFPEDGNNIGWSSNLLYAQQLAARLGLDVRVPLRPMFPIGNMFWARPAALKPLWDLNLTNADFPSEPVPYDGSILHAIERMTPTICELAGYKWATVYVDGVLR